MWTVLMALILYAPPYAPEVYDGREDRTPLPFGLVLGDIYRQPRR